MCSLQNVFRGDTAARPISHTRTSAPRPLSLDLSLVTCQVARALTSEDFSLSLPSSDGSCWSANDDCPETLADGERNLLAVRFKTESACQLSS